LLRQPCQAYAWLGSHAGVTHTHKSVGVETGGGRETAPVSVLPRKEVIQAHLPVHLPCYDFVPVTSPTFDGSFPDGLGHRLQVLPAPMT
jgi:hypothetical protein